MKHETPNPQHETPNPKADDLARHVGGLKWEATDTQHARLFEIRNFCTQNGSKNDPYFSKRPLG